MVTKMVTKIFKQTFFSAERNCFVMEVTLLKTLSIHSLIVGDLKFRYRHVPLLQRRAAAINVLLQT